MRGFAGKRTLWVVAAALMAGLVYWGRNDLHLILTLDPGWVCLCFGGTLGVALCAALKWQISLNAIGERRAAHFGSLLHYFMMGRAIGLVLPMDVSDLGVRTMSLKYNHSISVGRASYSVFLDRTFDVIVAGIFLAPSVLFIAGTLPARACMIMYALAYAGVFLSLVFFGRRSMHMLQRLFRLLFSLVCRIPWVGKRVGSGDDIDLLDSSEVTLIAPKLFLVSGLKFVLVSLRYYAIAAALGIALGSGEVMAFVPSAQYAALFALTPGGLGIADWSWSGLLYKIGVGKEHLVPYLISLRLVITLSVIFLALISRLAYRKPQPKER